MGWGDGPDKLDKIAIVEVLREKEKRTVAMGPQQEDIIKKPESRFMYRVFQF
jgi:hypothetical protein